ncbi:MAG: hypothetical protein J2P18_21590, partial [Nocardia sp.]|nr:hypothetical protein [Nocardia sp.]
TMYAGKQAIASALAQPSTDNGTATTWKSANGAAPPVTVVAQDSDLATGYACPRVYPAGAAIGFGTADPAQTADARHVVRRYLSRQTGHPLDASDQESTHPLLCTARTAWNPPGATAAEPPLAANPNKLSAPTAFADDSLSSNALNGSYLSVTASVTAKGAKQERNYTLKVTDNGYCVGDVSAGGPA